MKALTYLVIGSTCLSAACGAPTPVPHPVTITELEPTIGASALDVSDTGRIVGRSGGRGVVFEDAGAVPLVNLIGYTYCEAVAVANDGRIAGTCYRESANDYYPPSEAVFWQSAASTPQAVPLPASAREWVVDMNNQGIILGRAAAPGPASWIYDTNTQTLTALPAPPGARADANAINDSGDIVGTSRIYSPDGSSVTIEPVKWSAGTLAITVLPAAPSISDVLDINNSGAIVGVRNGDVVLWPSASAAPEELPAPAGMHLVSTTLTGLNDAGLIVGTTIVARNSDVARSEGIAWTADRRALLLGDKVLPEAVNASGLIVGSSNRRAARFELGTSEPQLLRGGT